MLNKTLTGLSMATILLAGSVAAETSATATTDLNLRAGPGPNYVIRGVIPAGEATTVDGCLADINWCQVTHNGTPGWAFGDYLAVPVNGEVVALYPNREVVKVATVDYDSADQANAALTLGVIGATAGALIVGGPAAIVVGALAGSFTGAAITPDETVVTYVTSNPVEPVFVNGEVVVGAGIPETVTLYQVPDAEYQYVNLNGQYVYVTPQDRKIVYIQR